MIYDTIIIGRGPAGVSAAIYLKRFNLNPLIIAKDDGVLAETEYIDNFYALGHITGKELVERGISHAKSLDISMIQAEVIEIMPLGETYLVKTNEGEYETKSVFLAMGKKKAQLKVATRNKFDGKGVSYCAICDGFFYKNKRIGVVGSGPFMENEYNVLKNFTKDLTIFTDGGKLDKTYDGVKVVEGKILELVGEDRLHSVKTADGEYEVDGLFIALGSQSGMSLSYHLGLEMDDKGFLKVNNFMTNLPGIFAGGDIIGGLLQVSKAVSDGASAALAIKKYLDNKKK